MALVLNSADLATALPYGRAISVLTEGFRRFAEGQYLMPQRLIVQSDDGVLATMPAVDGRYMAVKVATVHTRNPDRGLPAVQATVLLLDGRDGRLLSVLDGTTLTVIRTAAASAVATDALAPPGPASLGILGSGPLAVAHVRALAEVRHLEVVRLYSPRLSTKWPQIVDALTELRADLRPASSAEEVVRRSTIVVLATSAADPVLRWSWITPGTHVNAVGSHSPNARELDTDTIRHGRLVCDSVEACWLEAGDLLIPEHEGAVTRAHAQVSLGEVLLRVAHGRTSPEEVTIFKSVGLAFQDLCAAAAAWNEAVAQGLGTSWTM